MKKWHSLWLGLLLSIPGLVTAGQPTYQGHNVDVDPGIQVVDNADGSALVSGHFKLYNNQAASNALGAGDFTVKVDGNPVRATITPPNQSGTTKMADIVFCLDISGSMSDEISAVKNNTQGFVNKLSSQNFDVRLGLITFGGQSPPLRQRNNGQFYADPQAFVNEVSGLRASGGFEEWFDCLVYASQYPYRAGAERVTLLITDENGDNSNYNINTALPVVKNNASKVYGISYSNLGNVVNAVNETGGMLYNIRDPFDSILNKIADSIINKYGVSLITNVGPGTHQLGVVPSTNDPGGYDEEPFKIGANPVVSLTQPTQDLINAGVTPGPNTLNVEASVTDPDGGTIQQVNIIWDDPAGSGTNAMGSVGANIYSHTYSGTLDINKCFAFAIQAIDNEGRNTTVPANQGNTPGGKWRICANDTPPVISTITPDTYDYQQPVSISAEITDDKGAVAATLKYRELGDATWANTAMSDNGAGTYSGTVPANMAGFKGLEVEVVAQDTSNNVTTKPHQLTVNAVPVTIVDVTRHIDTTDTGPFSVHAVVAGLDLANSGQVNLIYSVNGSANTLPMTQAVTGTSAPMSTNSNIYVEKMPAVNPGDKVCYSVEASNPTANDKSAEICFEVLQPAAPLAITPASAIMVIGDSAAEFIASGGYGNYEWSSLNGTLSTTLADKTSYTPTLAGLDKLSIKDLKGFTATAIINVLPALAIDPAVDGKRFSPSATVQLTANGAQPPYQWQVEGASATVSGNDNDTVEISLGADPATIKVTVTDSNGRTQTVSFTNNGELRLDPATAELAVTPDSETPLTVSGGDGAYSWTVIGGDVDNPNGASVIYKAPSLPGVYHVTVSDGSGASATITMKVGHPLRVTPHCARISRGEKAEFQIVSGTPSYLWEADYGLLSDTSGEHIEYTPEPTLGLYEVTVHDGAGSLKTLCVQVTDDPIITPASAEVPINGTVPLTVTGGDGSYTWTADVGTPSPNTGNQITYTAPGQLGVATVTVTDGAGRKDTATLQITGVEIGPNITPTNATVAVNGTVALTVTGGLAPYTWTADVGSVDSSGTQVTYTAPGQAGTATVTVTDAKSASVAATINITDTGMAITPSVTGLEGGQTRDFTATGGDGNYNWTAAKGSLSATTGATVTYTAPNLADGEEDTVTVKDNSGNDTTATVRILSVIPDMAITPAKATVQVGGSQKFVAQNAVGKNVRWTTEGGSISDDGTFTAPASKGTYTITATDYTSGRTAQAEVVVTAEQLILTPKQARVNTSGSESFTVTGGQAPYIWQVAGEGSLDSHSGETVQFTAESTATKVRLLVTDNQGLSSEAEITVIGSMYITPEEVTLPRGGKQQFTAFGGSGTITWIAREGDIDNAGNYTAPQGLGTYEVTARDASGNKASVKVVVAEEVLIITPAKVWLDKNETRTLNVVGGTSPFCWTASAGSFSPKCGETVTYKAPNVSPTEPVTIKVSDNRGNTSEATAYVDLPLLADVEKFFIEPGQTRPVRVNGGIPSFDWQTNQGLLEKPTTEKAGENIYTAPKVMGDDSITIRDRKGNTTTVAVHVIRTLSVSPQKRYMKKNETKTFTVSGGVPPYSADASMGEIEPKQSDDGTFKFTSPGVGDQDVTIKFSDNGGQTVEVHAYVERQLRASSTTLYVDKNGKTKFKMTGGTGGFFAQADSGFADIDEDTGVGIYEAPNRYGEYDIKVVDSSEQETVMTAVVERQVPVISPLKVTMATGETKTFMVNRGAPDYEWAFEGNTWQGMDSGNSVIQITAPQTAGVYKLTVEDINGNVAKEPAIVTVFQPLLISPTSYPVYKGESVAVRFNKLGGSGACEWILTDLTEITKGPEFLVVRPRTDVELGTTYTVACRDQNGDTAQSKIIVGSLPGDLNGDGVIDDDEAQIAMDKYFNDEESLNGVPMDKNQLFLHIESNLIFN
jgi:hypothetical protein